MAKKYSSYTYGMGLNNPYSYSLGNPSSELGNLVADSFFNSRPYPDAYEDRTLLNRAFDFLLTPNYAIAGTAKGFFDNGQVDAITPWEGLQRGLKAGRVFGDGYSRGRYSFSDVLESAGWRPTSGVGKAARGVTGFILDVGLDPTTYISGGTSALVKGTGKGSAKAFTKATADELASRYGFKYSDPLDVPELVYESVAQKYAGKPVNPQLVHRLATKRSEEAYNLIAPTVNGMDKAMAEQVVRGRLAERGVKNVSDEQIAKDVDSLMRRYNRVLGIREPGRISMSLANAPFGEKIFGWTGVANKSLFDISDAGIRRFSDRAGIGEAYGTLRKAVYGTKFGRLFSNNAKLYQLSRTDPGAMYDFLSAMDHLKGLKLDKLGMEKALRNRAELLKIDLTPAESKKVLEILQDASKWSAIAKVVRFSDSEEANQLKGRIQEKHDTVKAELDDLTKMRDDIDAVRTANEQGVLDAREVLSRMEDEYGTRLLKLNEERAVQDLDYVRYLDLLEDHMKALDGQLVDANFGIGADIDVTQFGETVSNWRISRELFDENMKQVESLRKSMQKTKPVTSEADRIENNMIVAQNKEIGRQIQQLKSAAPNTIEGKHQIIDEISRYLYGETGQISKSIGDDVLNGLIDMVSSDSKAIVRRYVDNNMELFSGRSKVVNQFIAKALGYGYDMKYKNWNEYYVERMKALEGKEKARDASGELIGLNKEELRLKNHLIMKNIERQNWKARFSEAKNMDEVMQIISKYEDDMLMREVGDVENLWNTQAKSRQPKSVEDQTRDKIADDISADRIKSDRGYKELEDTEPYSFKLTQSEKDEIISDYVTFVPTGKITPQVVQQINRVVDEIPALLEGVFKRGYDSLTDSQKGLLFELANKNASGKGKVTKLGEEAKKAAQELKMRNDVKRISELEKNIDVGTTIYFNNDQRFLKGVVQEVVQNENKGKQYNVLLNNGEVLEGVQPRYVTRFVSTSGKKKSAEDLILESKPLRDVLVERSNVLRQMDEVSLQRELNKESIDAEKKKVLEDYVQRNRNMIDAIKAMEDTVADSKDALYRNFDEDAFNEKARQVARMEEVLNNDDAFETYIRSLPKYGDSFVRRVVQGMKTPAAIMMEKDKDVNEKIIDMVKFLRAEFQDMGRREVDIGKLKSGQFEEMKDRYVPHILTAEGEEFFNKFRFGVDKDGKLIAVPRNIKKDGAFLTQDLGFGRVWNQFGMSRSFKIKDEHGNIIKNPTIEQINEELRNNEQINELLKGKNLFSEDLADVYLTRGLKSLELFYDNRYMDTMMNTFGKEVNAFSDVEKGYKAVFNAGKLKEIVRQVVKNRVTSELSQEASEQMSEKYKELHRLAKQRVTDFIRSNREDYLREQSKRGMSASMKRFSKEEMDILHNRFFDEILEERGRPELDKLSEEDLATRFANGQEKFLAELGLGKQQFDEMLTPMVELTENQFSKLKLYAPEHIRQVNDAIVQKANQARKIQIGRDMSKFLTIYDKFTHWFKLNQTTVMPSFHARNKMSNIFLNWLAVGKDAFNMKMQRDAFRALRSEGKNDKLKPIAIRRPDGSLDSMTWEDAMILAKDYDVVDEGFFAKDIGAQTATKGLFKNMNPKFDPTDTENFILYKKGAEVGNMIENSDRLIQFISHLKNGKSAEQAAELTRKFLFDYSDITAFEANVMKRIIPFYVWMRKNTKLQLEQMLEQPGKYQLVAKALQGIEGMNDEQDQINFSFVNEFAKDWVQMPFSVLNPSGRLEPVLFNPNMPFQDISRIPNPMRPFESLKKLTSISNPLLKIPAEQLFNYQTYFEQPIGNTFGSRADHVASNLSLYNAGKDLVTKSGLDWGLELMANTTGIKLLSYDYEKYKYQVLQEVLQRKPSLDELAFQGISSAANAAYSAVEELFGDAVTHIEKGKPLEAGLYRGALAPISKTSYDKLTEEEKSKYTPPTNADVMAFNIEAVKLEEEAYKSSGVVNKFLWSLIDGFNLGKKDSKYTVGYVTDVIDGDTFRVRIGDKVENVRMLLVDTPESVKEVMPFGNEASQYSKSHLMDRDVRLVFEGDERDKYGRMLAYIEVKDQDFNRQVLSEGLGKFRYNYGDYSRAPGYLDAEEEAAEAQRGLWSLEGYSRPGVDVGFNNTPEIRRRYVEQQMNR